jgi:hypothetical protein
LVVIADGLVLMLKLGGVVLELGDVVDRCKRSKVSKEKGRRGREKTDPCSESPTCSPSNPAQTATPPSNPQTAAPSLSSSSSPQACGSPSAPDFASKVNLLPLPVHTPRTDRASSPSSAVADRSADRDEPKERSRTERGWEEWRSRRRMKRYGSEIRRFR